MVENIQSDVLQGDGKTKYLRDTDKDCPACHKQDLKVKTDLEDTVELECPNCLYNEFKPSTEFPPESLVDIKGRPITPTRS